MASKKVLIPLPTYGCDPSEVGIPWKLMNEAGFEIVFATPTGDKAVTDKIMLSGKRLGLWRPILAARKDAVDAFNKMEKVDTFWNPIKYKDISEKDFDAIYLPGGHDKGVKEYLESEVLFRSIANFFDNKKPVGAICHGVVLVARSKDPRSGKSVIYNHKTTSLLNSQELMAYTMTRLWLKDYYLTYPKITVENEVKSLLSSPSNFVSGPTPLFKDSPQKLNRGFFVRDQNYISARWPGDLYNFTLEFIKMIELTD